MQVLEPTHPGLLDRIADNPLNLPTLQDIASSHALLSERADSLHMEVVPQLHELQTLKTKAQRTLTDILYRDLDRQIHEMAAEDTEANKHLARIKSCKGYGASHWLTAIPKVGCFRMEPADFVCALRFRLRMKQPCIFAGSTCRACHTAVDEYGDHYLTCTAGGNQLTLRHDTILSHIVDMTRTAGCITRTTKLSGLLDPYTLSHPDTGKALKPDALHLCWEEDGRDTFSDVVCSHPCGDSYVAQAARTSLHTATYWEKRKRHVYEQACKCKGYSFTPLACESYGAMGADLERTVKKAVATMAAKLPKDHLRVAGVNTWTASTFHLHFLQRIGIAIQRGNAKAIRYRAQRDFRVSSRERRPLSPPVDHLASDD
jgi:hypothetical protein